MKKLSLFFAISIVSANAENYACMGTEPFWNLNVSEAEGSIVFFSPTNPEGVEFPYVAPLQAQGFVDNFVQLYVAPSSAKHKMPTLTIIKNDKCTDGMTESVYGYEAVVYDGSDSVLYGCCTTASKR